MSLPVILRPAADADVQDTHEELERAQAGLGDRFVARVRELLARIEAIPQMYGVVWQDVRAARLRKFRHVVYYVAFADRVEVLGRAARFPGSVRLAIACLIRPGRTSRCTRPRRHSGFPRFNVSPAPASVER